MKTIRKFALKPTESQELDIQPEATCIMVANQGNDLCIWFEVPNDQDPVVRRMFKIYGTGHRIPEDINLLHLGSGFMLGGVSVWHVYEQLPEENY